MKVTSAYANKLIRGYREELAALISSEKDTCTTVYGASEEKSPFQNEGCTRTRPKQRLPF